MKKSNKKGFFLSETMVVLAVVSVVLLSVFKLFNSVYFGFSQSEKYNTASAINALSNIQKYYETIEGIDVNLIAEDVSYIDLTNATQYESSYYERIKKELNIDSVYLIDLNKLFTNNDIDSLYVTLKNYVKTLKNLNSIVLVVVLNSNEFAYVKLEENTNVELIGNKDDEYAVYIPIGEVFIDPGYKNWNGEEPATYWENGKELDINKAGTYYLFYEFGEYIFKRRIEVGNFETNFTYTGDYQEYNVPYDGYYKVELWGAQGGDSTLGGKGAYISGIIKLNKEENLFLYVGGEGKSESTLSNVGGYNGGGYSGGHQDFYSYGGGGATDIRLNGGLWNNETGLNSRIMVAAGGAGVPNFPGILSGGAGGELMGNNGVAVPESMFNTSEYLNKGATQKGSGYAYFSEGTEDATLRSGKFGYAPQQSTPGWGGGGGGGYYGGSNGFGTTGSGGSSFISGYAGVNAITSSTDRTHTYNTLHYSNKYFIDGEMKAGINTGNGKAKITYIGNYVERNSDFDNVRYIKDCTNENSLNYGNHWSEVQAISNGLNVAKNKTLSADKPIFNANEKYAVDGDLFNVTGDTGFSALSYNDGIKHCLTVDLEDIYNLDEIVVWHYWDDGRSYNEHSLYVSSDNENWTTLIDNVSGVTETINGIRVSAYD